MKILSGVFEDDRTGGPVTTGTPISLMIENIDQRSKDYSEIRDSYRPGHADYVYDQKYGVRDYRGGGRSSARETASRVAAGAIARLVLGPSITIRAAVVQIGPHAIDRAKWDWDEVREQSLLVPRQGRGREVGRRSSTRRARPARPAAPSSRSSPRACPPAGARRSMASSTPTSPPR